MSQVLIIDDSLVERMTLKAYLEPTGLQVLTASSASEAMYVLESVSPQIIVLDIVMKDMSGFQFCRKLKNNLATKLIPIVMCSSKSTEVDKVWANILGANAYLTKPVDRQKFVNTIWSLTIEAKKKTRARSYYSIQS